MSQKLESKKRIDIHNYEARIKQVTNQIERELSPENVRLIQKYDQEMVRQTIALATRQKHLRTVLNLSRLVGKDWLKVIKDDIDELVFKIMKLYSDGTGKETNYSYDHKKILKIFYRWMKLGSREHREVGDPEETKHVRMRRVRDKIAREDLLTESDRTRLLHACGENSRDRAFIDCHFEAGTRPGEILNLQIKHVKFDKYGAVIHVDGKTGTRTIRLVKSTPSLANWLESHPFKDNSDAPLWPNISHHKFGEPLTYAGARKMMQMRCKRANLSKRVFLNLFRHSEATQTANFMTEAQMRKRHGWSADSKMPSKYVHLINSDVEKAIFSHYGIKNETEQEVEALPKKCHFCQIPNSFDATICSKCGRPFDVKTALSVEENERKEKEEFTQKISQLEKQQQKSNEILDLILNMIEDAQKNNSKIIIKRNRTIPLFSKK